MYPIIIKELQNLLKSFVALMRFNFIQGNRFRNLFFLLSFLFMSFSVSAATYYVSNSGNDANNGLSEATPWKTLSKVSGLRIIGDVALLKRGNIWREKLNPYTGISVGAYGIGDNPIIDGADIINAMTSIGSNIWQKTGITIQPNLMYLSGTIGYPKTSLGACNSEGDWFWDSGTKVFSIYSVSDPSGNVELGQRTRIVDSYDWNNITISNLTIQHSNEGSIPGYEWWGGALNSSGGDYLTITGCIIQENSLYGAYILNSSHVTFDNNNFLRNGEGHKNGGNVRFFSGIPGVSNIIFTNNQCNYGADGLLIHTVLKANHIRNVNIHGNHFNFNNSAGLYIQMLDSVVVYDNYFNGNGNPSRPESYGIGITSCDNTDIYQNIITNQQYNDAIQLYSDSDPVYGSSNNVRIFRNYISGVTFGDGIGLGVIDDQNCQNLQIYYNTIIKAEMNGVNLWHSGTGTASSVNIYNNTFYENGGGVHGTTPGFQFVLKNNIFVNNGEPDVRSATTGLTHSNNLYYRTSGNVLSYNGSTYTNATIKGFEPGAQNIDPLFTDADNGDFTLRKGSPAINAGLDVGLTSDILGNPIVGNPDMGAYEYNVPVFSTEFKSICDGTSYQGWTVTGKYERTLIAQSSVDSIVTTYLTVNQTYSVTEDITINEGENYNGWSTSGQYTRTLYAVTGCDSIVTTNLTVSINTGKEGNVIDTQSIALKKGNNLVSTYLLPENPDISVVFQSLIDQGNLIKIQNETGNSLENWSAYGGWINQIGTLSKTEGYNVNVKFDCNLDVTGTQVPLPLDIQLTKGWNFISFPQTETVNATAVIQALINQNKLVKVQDETGNSIEDWANYGGWINNIGNFYPGKGYRIYANDNVNLTIQPNYLKSALISASTQQTEYFSTAYEGNGTDHMNINIVGLQESGWTVGDELAAYDGEICVGALKITSKHLLSGIASLVSSSSTDEHNKNGFTSGNQIIIYSWNKKTREQTSVQTEILDGDRIFAKNASVLLKMTGLTTVLKQLDQLVKIDVFANPCRGNFTVRLSEMTVNDGRIDILEGSGRMINSRVISDLSEVFNLQNQASGLYLVKTIIGSNSIIHKLIVNK
jgi:hypothetical protein